MGDDITIGVTEIVNNIEVTAQPNDQIVDISVIDNADDVTLNITPTVIEINVNKGSSYAKWGTILGTLSDQTDLQNALDLKANLVGGKVPASELPSYVDDVVEVADYAALPATGETGKIYVTLDNNKIYRWSGSIYIEIAANSAIWGAITGTLSSQTDLQNALNAKFDDPTGDTTQYIAGDGSLITFPIAGQSGTLVREVRNTTGATLLKGTVVYINGATGNKPTIAKALATGDSTSAQTFGMLQADISNNANGYVVCVGDIIGLDTSAITEGTQLYLSSTTAGAYTSTKQLAPAHLVYVGVVTRSHPTLGQIEVKIQNGYELDEIHDVSITSKINNQFLVYESATDLWKNKSLGTILGGTSSQFVKGDGSLDSNVYALDSAVVHLTGNETISGTKTFSSILKSGLLFINETGGFGNITGFTQLGGTADYFQVINGANTKSTKFIHNGGRSLTMPATDGTLALTSQLHDALTIGTANGLSLSGQALSLALASTSTTGALSSTDWNKFNNNIPSGTPNVGDYVIYNGSNLSYRTVLTTSPLSFNVSTGTFAISQATTSANGYLSSTDWNTFNNKVPTARTLTINGTAYDLSADRSWTITAGISGSGTTGKIPLFTGSTALGDSSLTEFSTYLNLTKPLTIAYSTATSASGLNLSLNNGGSTGTTLYVFNAGTGNLAQFQKSDNTAAFLINAAGNVGIGTTSPNQLLHIEKDQNTYTNLRVRNNDAGSSAYTMIGLNSSGNSWGMRMGSSAANSNRLDFVIDAFGSPVERMSITSGGNVGIGTPSPAVKLQIAQTASGTTNNFTQLITSSDGGKGLYQGFDVTNRRFYWRKNDSDDYSFSWQKGDGTSMMLINSAGNVGIGTTSPQTKIDTLGVVRSSTTTFTSGGNIGSFGFGSPTYGGTLWSEISSNFEGANWFNGANLIFKTSSSSDITANPSVERMRITSGGNVLIGTTTDSGDKLHVNGPIRLTGTDTIIKLHNTVGTPQNWWIGQDTSGTGNGIFYIYNSTSGVQSLNINKSNNATFAGTVTATAFIPTSDIRLKNLIDYNYNVELIKPITYTWKDSEDKRRKIGYSAQQVQEVLPEVVNTDEKGMLSVDYNQIFVAKIDMLQNMIQELKAEIEILKNK